MQRLRHGKQGYSINMKQVKLFLLHQINLIWCFFMSWDFILEGIKLSVTSPPTLYYLKKV